MNYGEYQSTQVAKAAGSKTKIQTDEFGNARTSTGGVMNATAPTLTSGQRGDTQLDVNGNTKVLTMGAQTIESGQITVGTTATAIIGGRKRSRVRITSHAATALFLGGAGVTTATGYRLPATDGASIIIEASAAIYGIVAAGTLVVSYLDEYNV